MIGLPWRRLGWGNSADDIDEASGLFQEINELKDLKDTDPDIDVSKYNSTIFGQIARAKAFELVTVIMIMLNALEIGWDADYAARWKKPANLYDTQNKFELIAFAVSENVFAVYFTVEILIRFVAYAKKITCVSDGWFIFDTALVTLMVIETWILPFVGAGGPLAQFSVLRLVRLVRITRLVKLMKALPELMLIVKGITAATRAVVWTAILLVIISYTWAIIFTNEFHQGYAADEDVSEDIRHFFGSMGKSMLSLLIMGTILDDVTACTEMIRSTENMWMLVAFILYIVLNSFMIMNMLVGILVEVVESTAEGEKKRAVHECLKESFKAITQMDIDKDGKLSRQEFLEMKENPSVMEALNTLEIDHKQFDAYVELVLERNPEPKMEELLDAIQQLRPGTSVSALDFAVFREHIRMSQKQVKDRVRNIEKTCIFLNKDPHVFFRPPSSQHYHNSSTADSSCKLPADQMPFPRRVSNEGQSAMPPKHRFQENQMKVGVDVFAALDRTSGTDIINELQRRFKTAGLDKTGLPMTMMEEDLQNLVKSAEAFQSLGVPLPDPEWSNKTLIC